MLVGPGKGIPYPDLIKAALDVYRTIRLVQEIGEQDAEARTKAEREQQEARQAYVNVAEGGDMLADDPERLQLDIDRLTEEVDKSLWNGLRLDRDLGEKPAYKQGEVKGMVDDLKSISSQINRWG